MKNGKQVVRWTQGANFAFKAGDVLYDSPDAYSDWLTALKRLGTSIQVRGATVGFAAQASGPRTSGSIQFDLFVPSKDKSRLVKSGSHHMSQDDFVRYLISGEGLHD